LERKREADRKRIVAAMVSTHGRARLAPGS